MFQLLAQTPAWVQTFVLGMVVGGFVMMHMTKQWEICRSYHSYPKCIYLTVKYPW